MKAQKRRRFSIFLTEAAYKELEGIAKDMGVPRHAAMMILHTAGKKAWRKFYE